MKQFIVGALALTALAACGGGSTTSPDSASAATLPVGELTLTAADLKAIDLTVNGDPSEGASLSSAQRARAEIPLEEAAAVIKRVGALMADSERGVTLVFDGPIKASAHRTDQGTLATYSFVGPAQQMLGDYVADGRQDARWVLQDAAQEVLRGFLRNPSNVDLVAPFVMKDLIGGDAQEFLKTGRSVLTQKFVPVPGDADTWYATFRHPSPDHPDALEDEKLKVATAVVKKVIPDLNPSAVSLYMFLHRRYAEGGFELVETYQKWGRKVIGIN